MKLIRIEIEGKSKTGLFFSTSPDMRGFFDVGYSIEELESSAPNIIRDLHAAAGENVNVRRHDGNRLVFIVEPDGA